MFFRFHYQPFADGLCEVTNKHSVPEPGLVAEQEAKRSFGSVEVDRVGTESPTDLHLLTKHSLTDYHVPGVNTQPSPYINVHAHVSADTSPRFDGACQLEPQWGSPNFIMPLAPLGIDSALLCQTSSRSKGDQACAKRSLNDNRHISCDHILPSVPWPTLDGITDKPALEGDELIQKKGNAIDSSEKSASQEQVDLTSTKRFFTAKTTVNEDITDLSTELSNLAVLPADHFIISEENRVAIITLDLNDPFVSRAAKPIATKPERAELNQKTAEKMPHKTHKSTSESKTRSKKDKSAAHHYGAQASKKQENLSHQVSAPQVCKQQDTHSPTGDDHTGENTPARLEDKEVKPMIETGVAAEKTSAKPHGKKKKKHAHSTTGVKSAGEPLVEVENGAKPKAAKGRIDIMEAKLGAKAGKAEKDRDAEKKPQQPEAKASKAEQPPHHTDHKGHQTKNFTSPLNDDIIKRRRLSDNKFGRIVSVLESKLPKPDVSVPAKGEELKVDTGAIHKKAYSEVVKQKIPTKEGKK